MARVLPQLDEVALSAVRSSAEARFYCHCRDQLPGDWTVLYSVQSIRTSFGGRLRDGEADFVILVPKQGMLVVEVKGGGIEFRPGENNWYSTDRHGKPHQIKDPFAQAKEEKFALLRMLNEEPKWRAIQPGKITIGHGVLLPDADQTEGLVGPNSPREILGGRRNFARAEQWILSVLDHWRVSDGSSSGIELSSNGVKFIENFFFGRRFARPLLATRLAEEEGLRIALTEQQSRVLRSLGARKRAVITGGAGTGKTLLALERARMCAAKGLKTLLLTYNRLLADFLKHATLDDQRIFAMSFHQLCEWRARLASEASGRDLISEAREAFPARGGSEYFDQQLPFALVLSTEVLEERFDAIIVDEAQDFRQDYWAGVELLMSSEEDGFLFIFSDPNQALYSRAEAVPVKEFPFALTANCRNTVAIHKLAYQFYRGDETDPPEENVGAPVDFLPAPSLASQATSIHALVGSLLSKEGVSAGQIAVLVCGQPKAEYYDALVSKPLPRGTGWRVEGSAASAGVRVDTVSRFKGLEADVVLLWGLDTVRSAERVETLYVGISRAKSRLHVVARADVLRELGESSSSRQA